MTGVKLTASKGLNSVCSSMSGWLKPRMALLVSCVSLVALGAIGHILLKTNVLSHLNSHAIEVGSNISIIAGSVGFLYFLGKDKDAYSKEARKVNRFNNEVFG